MHSIINIDLNVPCYFASIQEMINDYSINNIYNILKIPISYLYVEI
jgi:hypothetical protein